MLKNILLLAEKLISIKSDPGNAKELEKALNLALSNLKGFTVERFERNGIKSALVYNTPKRPKKFKILFNTHLDVIPGKPSQYIPRIKGDRLYGVGSMDMKANLACVIQAFKDVASMIDYPVALQLVTDEEVGGFDGTKYQVEKGVRADFVLASEPTCLDIVYQAKGIIWLKVSARGKTAHGAYPWRGENAIWKMNEFLSRLSQEYPLPREQAWVTTTNLATIATENTAFNKIPDDCVVGLDIRYIPEDEEAVIKRVKKILPKGFVLEVLCKEPALATDAQNEYVKILEAIGKRITKKKLVLRGAQGSSDARHFAGVGCPGIEFGPVGEGIGSDDEWVSISSLETYYQILKEFLLSFSRKK